MIAMTKKELATIAGYTYRRLYDIDKGLPGDAKLFVETEGGKYDLPLFVQRWVQYNINSEAGDDSTLDEVKAIHERVKIQKSEIELAKMRGELVGIQDVRRIWSDVANTVMQNMLHLASKVAPLLTMMDNVGAIAGIIDGEVRDVLTQIAETPLPEYAQRQGEDETSNDEKKEGEA